MTTTNQHAVKGGRLFGPGRTVSTPGALATFTEMELRDCFARHLTGDWGDIPDEDKERNDDAVGDGSRILSAYHIGGEKLWIITEAADDEGIRHATTFLLPEEY